MNEGPATGGVTTYNMLHPTPSTNSGSPYLNADQKVETGWMVFDEHQGTEKFWVVWAAQPVPELDAVKGVMNQTDKGAISDAEQAKAVRDFLEKHSSEKPEAQKDAGKKQTSLKGKGDVLVHLLELEHH